MFTELVQPILEFEFFYKSRSLQFKNFKEEYIYNKNYNIF